MFGFIKKVLGKGKMPAQKERQEQKLTLSAEIIFPEKTEEELLIRKLGKEATALKKENLPAAIEKLRQAQALRPSVPTEYPIAEYLRLPLFLQQAGRMDEALTEFEKLLKQFPRGDEWRDIYDKMRLAYQREKAFDQAVVCGVMSIGATLVSAVQHKQRRLAEVKRVALKLEEAPDFRKNFWKDRLEKEKQRAKTWNKKTDEHFAATLARAPEEIANLLKKAKRPELTEIIMDDLMAFSENPSLDGIKELGEQVASHLTTTLPSG